MKTKNLIKLCCGIAGAVVVIGGITLLTCTTIIKPGYVGIKYNMNGGVQDETLTQGFHFVGPLTKVKQYTVATEQAYLSKDAEEGSEKDNSFIIPTSDGKTVNVDMEFSYHFDPDMLPQTYTRFKGQSGKDIEETFIRGKIKAWASEVSSNFSVIDIYGSKRADLNNAVLAHVQDEFKPYGIAIDSVNFTRIGLDEQTEKAIQDRINKQQELKSAKIETEKAKEAAKKKEVEAEANAKAKQIEAEGQAKANQELANSITPELIQMKEAEARLQHGWVTVQGGTPVVDAKNN